MRLSSPTVRCLATALRACVGLALGLVVAPRPAGAQRLSPDPAGFDVQLFQPSPSPQSLLSLDLPAVSGHLAFTGGFSATYVGTALDLHDGRERLAVRDALQLEALAALGLFEVIELGVAMPVVNQTAPEDTDASQSLAPSRLAVSGVTAGDLRGYVKVPFLRGRTRMAARVMASFPTGGAQHFAGSTGWSFAPALAVSRAFGSLTLAANVGFRLSEGNRVGTFSVNDELTLHVGAQYTFTPRVAAMAEGLVRVTLNPADGATRQVPAELFAGARFFVTPSFALSAGVGKGLSSGYGSSDFRGILGLRFTIDRRQPCRHGPEDFDGYEDGDFCADPDNDGDGVPDEDDRCPNDREDADGVLDQDGCAEPDNDGDGLLDDVDRCPLEPEDHDAWRDDDGCPEADNDGDRIPDTLDLACPNDPEDADNFQDDDGCPEPGPDAAVVTRTDSRLLLSQRVYFDYDSDTIRNVSFPILNEVASTLRRNPDIRRMRVEGYTDAQGTPEYNLDLSFRRARAVVEYVIARGVDRDRLEFQGYGQTRPVAGGGTSEGEALNRRVEFTILQQDAPAVTTPAGPTATTTTAPARRPGARPPRRPRPRPVPRPRRHRSR